MGEMIDKVKGKAKQVQGIITGDEALRNEGKVDEAKGNAEGVINKIEGAVHDAVDAVKQAVKKI